MKRTVLTSSLLAALALVLAQPALHAEPACNLASLNGKFSYTMHGVSPAGTPFAVVGVFTADGAGHFSGSRVSLEDGVRSTGNFTCSYSMSPDCMFRTGASCVDEGEAVSEVTIDGALADNRRQAYLLATGLPAGGLAVVSGEARKQ